MLAKTTSCHFEGLATEPVTVETQILGGFSQFYIVGLAGTSIQEARERIRSAIVSMGIRLPPGRIVVNLYPGDVPKGGTQWDLPIAVTLLAAMGALEPSLLETVAFLGELSLDGHCRPVPGAFAMVLTLQKAGIKTVYLPLENLKECLEIGGMQFIPVTSLQEAVAKCRGQIDCGAIIGRHCDKKPEAWRNDLPDFRDLRGQEPLKRLLEVAIAGRHSLLLIGPPGVGKSMAISRVPSILPWLTPEEEVEVLCVHSACGISVHAHPMPPFRTPHHTITPAALLGGGNPPIPGEISLAHHGILFLDEMPQFSIKALNGLRTPLEQHHITISRARRRVEAPTDFQLLATANPCLCGYLGDPDHTCNCSPSAIKRYRARLSGPLLDRMDMVFTISTRMTSQENVTVISKSGANSASMREHIVMARKRQIERYRPFDFSVNARFPDTLPAALLQLSDKAEQLLRQLSEHYALSYRAQKRLLCVARTIADLDECDFITSSAVAEAFQYRRAAEEWRRSSVF